ncbi:hypothetical protein CSOJ01_08348 [Colletotrichum sojae]|uniref:Uncharacterized protein n=1 Tax=Colletotrichum sojae TaxID=2175907 RepID=A0A8H6J5Z9_9PEZI|nr:hypothetical protein CSOJ01_08348 [Colletotrichum sojae]
MTSHRAACEGPSHLTSMTMILQKGGGGQNIPCVSPTGGRRRGAEPERLDDQLFTHLAPVNGRSSTIQAHPAPPSPKRV